MAPAHQPSRQPTHRVIKSLATPANNTQLLVFLQELTKQGQQIEFARITTPDLEHHRHQIFTYRPDLNSFAPISSEHEEEARDYLDEGRLDPNQYLLPADLVRILKDIYAWVKEELKRRSHLLSQSGLASTGLSLDRLISSQELGALETLGADRAYKIGKEFISFNKEQSLLEKLESENYITAFVAASGLAKIAQYLMQPVAAEESADQPSEIEEASETTDSNAATNVILGNAAQKIAEALKQKSANVDAERPTEDLASIFSPELEKVVTAYSVATINSILGHYTRNRDVGLDGVSFDQLEESLQQELLHLVAPQVRTSILSLGPQRISVLVNGGNGAASIRIEALRQSQQLVLTQVVQGSVRARNALQTAVDNYFYLLRNQPDLTQKLKEKIAGTDHFTVLKQVAKHQEAELLQEQIEQFELPMGEAQKQDEADLLNVFSRSNSSLQILENQLQLLLGDQLDAEKITLAAINIDRRLTALIIDDATLHPSYVNHLNYFNFSLHFGQILTPTQFSQHEAELKNLVKQIIYLKQASLFHDHPELATARDQRHAEFADTSSDQFKQPKVEARARRIGRIGAVLKDKAMSENEAFGIISNRFIDRNESRADEATSSKHHKLIYRFKLELWKSLEQEDREKIRAHILGEAARAEALTEAAQQQFLNQIDYLMLLEARIQVAQVEAQMHLRAQLAQNEAVMQANYLQTLLTQNQFLSSGENYAGGERATYQHLPNLSGSEPGGFLNQLQERLGLTQAFGDQSQDGVKNVIDRLGVEATDKALMLATQGTYAAIPRPLREMLNQVAYHRLKQILKVAGAILGGFFGLMLAALATIGIVGGAALGGLIGGVILGPLGVGLGAIAGAGTSVVLQNLKASSAATSSAASELGAESAGTGIESSSMHTASGQSSGSFSRAVSDSIGNAVSKLTRSPTTNAATVAAPQNSFWSALASNPAAASLTATGTIVIGTTALTLTVLQAAFLADWPYSPVPGTFDADKQISRYVRLEKRANVQNNFCPSNQCDPIVADTLEVEYTIDISPRDNYQITIVSIEDKSIVSHNEEAWEEDFPDDYEERLERARDFIENNTTSERQLSFFNLPEEDLTINPGETLTLSYDKILTPDYNHSNLRNTFRLGFIYNSDQESGNSDAITAEVLCIGDCPQGIGCWPTTGLITQLPFNRSHSNLTHSRGLDAFDISAATGENIYSPFNGNLCVGTAFDEDAYRAGVLGPMAAYGHYVTLDAEIGGQTYTFLFGHLMEISPLFTNEVLAHQPDNCVTVYAGEVIGQVGSTGNSTGPHLHFELRNSPARPGSSSNLQYELSDLMPDGWEVTTDPQSKVVSCFDQMNYD